MSFTGDVAADTWYCVSAKSPPVDVQVLPSSESWPASSPAEVSWDLLAPRSTFTDCSGALLRTTTVLVSATPWERSVGVTVICGAVAVGAVRLPGADAEPPPSGRGEHEVRAIQASSAAPTVDMSDRCEGDMPRGRAPLAPCAPPTPSGLLTP